MFSKLTTYFLDSGRLEAKETNDGLLCISDDLRYEGESLCLSEQEQDELGTLLTFLRHNRQS